MRIISGMFLSLLETGNVNQFLTIFSIVQETFE